MAARKKQAAKKQRGQKPPVKNKQKRDPKDIDPADRGSGRKRATTHHKFTAAVRQQYLDNLAEFGTKIKSADAAGVSYGAVKNYLATHPEFQKDVDEALERYRDMLLDEMKRRAVEGYIKKPLTDKDGAIVGYEVVKSDRLLEFAIKRVDPTSRESIQKVEHKGSMVTAAVPFDVKKLEKLTKKGRDALRLVLKEIGTDDGRAESDSSES